MQDFEWGKPSAAAGWDRGEAQARNGENDEYEKPSQLSKDPFEN